MRTNHFFQIVAILSLLAVGCKDDEKMIPVECTGIEWTYDEANNGQDHWIDLCQGYSACGGKSQSPININIAAAVDGSTLPDLEFDYHATEVEIENNGHTIEFVCHSGSTLTIGTTQYSLAQFHYHAQSEHELNGAHFPLEVHFVHKASDTDYAVVGVFFEEGAENELFTKYLSHFPLKEGVYESPEEIELIDLLPTNKSFYNYGGSLTTPPCSEVVKWFVLKNKITASASQIAQFKSILHDNSRKVQSLDGRVLYSHDS